LVNGYVFSDKISRFCEKFKSENQKKYKKILSAYSPQINFFKKIKN